MEFSGHCGPVTERVVASFRRSPAARKGGGTCIQDVIWLASVLKFGILYKICYLQGSRKLWVPLGQDTKCLQGLLTIVNIEESFMWPLNNINTLE